MKNIYRYIQSDYYRYTGVMGVIPVDSSWYLWQESLLQIQLLATLSKYKQSYNYVEFQKYNYTLDRFSNLIRESATLLKSKMDGKLFEEMVEADILLYYLSLVYTKTEEVYDMWYPELSIYNFCFTILPKLVSNRYFEKAKILFGVDGKESFITLDKGLKDNLQRDGYHHIPSVQQGLGLDKICSIR